MPGDGQHVRYFAESLLTLGDEPGEEDEVEEDS